MNPKNRKEDTMTHNVSMIIISFMVTLFVGLISYVYTKDQSATEKFMFVMTETVGEMTGKIGEIAADVKLARAWSMNTEARIAKIEDKQERLWDKIK